MTEKRISYTQFQSVRSVAKACDPIARKMESTRKKIESLVNEYRGYQLQIDALEAGILQVIGYHVSDLVKKVYETNVDSKGNTVKTAKYLPTDIVTYDESKKQYVIAVLSEEDLPLPTTEEKPGSDFDIDKENAENEDFDFPFEDDEPEQ